MGLKETFEKQGGMTLIKRYWKSGALFTAIGEFLLLGKSRTALEILRLSTQLKARQKLEKKYKSKLKAFDDEYDESLPHVSSNKVWVCWFQGIENAPDLVKMCYQSLQKNLINREIIFLTEKNYREYICFPDYIQKKIDMGIIKGAHMSDLMRLELLIKYGGIWIDSTVFCTGCEIPEYMLNSDLFLFQCLKPGRDGHTTVISNWLITATTNNRILMLTRDLLYEYWNEYDDLIDYFIFHDFFQMVIEKHPEDWNKVIPFDNATPHILLLRLFDEYNEDVWNAITKKTPFHKLTYKFEDSKTLKTNTYYKHLMNANVR